MLRRSYQGIGKRGIGVGYPGGVNLALRCRAVEARNDLEGEVCGSCREFGEARGTELFALLAAS